MEAGGYFGRAVFWDLRKNSIQLSVGFHVKFTVLACLESWHEASSNYCIQVHESGVSFERTDL